MIKRKPTSAQRTANGPDRSKAAETHAKSNGHARRSPASPRSNKAPAQAAEHAAEKFRGMLQEFNLSPKGGIEGFLLHFDGQTVQVNVTPDVGFAAVRGIGQHVEATVEPDAEAAKHAKGSHSVYTLVTLTGPDGKTLIHSGGSNVEMITVQGTVKRINYSRHGVANGVVLDSGDFIYLKPEGMKKLDLKVGEQVTAEGTASLMPLGQQVVEAKTVNGTALSSKKPVRAAARRARS
jgi:hypothetical protein